MAPQTSIPTVANVLGTIGTVFWCVQLIPQVWRNYRTKSTEGLPAMMMFLWSACSVPFGVYAIVQNFNIPIMVQPQCFGLLCLITWGQCLIYGRKWRTTTITLLLALIALFAGLQTLLVFLIRPAYHRGTSWPVTLVGVIAAVLLISGYIPVPFEILKRRGRVVGIDFGFLTIDWLGAFFSLMAIATQNSVDVLGVVMYSVCAAIEAGIFISQAIWLLRTRSIRRRAKEAAIPYEDFPEAQTWQANGFKLTLPTWRRKAEADEKSSGNTSASASTVCVAVEDERSEELAAREMEGGESV
ncbi:MAG: hypothetical protein LQ350_007391 [Teloschistes chrysophthalmus]|nr:MAG: hypothetical protein LQ350_007391 [Niorma chrysophthalma]